MKIECIETTYWRRNESTRDRDVFTNGRPKVHPHIVKWYRATFNKDVDVKTTGKGSCEEYEMRIWTTWTLSEQEYTMFLLKFK